METRDYHQDLIRVGFKHCLSSFQWFRYYSYRNNLFFLVTAPKALLCLNTNLTIVIVIGIKLFFCNFFFFYYSYENVLNRILNCAFAMVHGNYCTQYITTTTAVRIDCLFKSVIIWCACKSDRDFERIFLKPFARENVQTYLCLCQSTHSVKINMQS